ncbi:MAG: ABC transporter permease [Pseudomonadota bacterium]
MATTSYSSGARKGRISTRFLINAAVTVFGALLVYFLVNLLIGGECGGRCVVGTLAQTVRVATPIALAAYCAVMCERAGVINIGIEGQMLTAAMIAYGVNVYLFDALQRGGMDPMVAGNTSRWVALLAAMAGSALMGMLHAVTSIRFRADQVISGTVLNILAMGLTGYMYRQFLAQNIPPGPGTFPIFDIPLLAHIPIVGEIFFAGQKPLVYLMLLLTLLLHFVLFYTPWGLRTRAVGEHPQAADTLGIDVIRVRYANVLLGSMIAGMGGAWFTLEAVDVFNPLMTNGLGFIGIAAMIVGNWMPFGALFGALIFGLGTAIQPLLSMFRPDIPSQFPQMIPYVLTIIVVAGVIGGVRPPAAEGKPYTKE